MLKVKEDYPIMEAEVFQGQGIKGGVRTQSRDTNRYGIECHNFNPKLLQKFTDFVNEEGIVANQTDYLEYGEGHLGAWREISWGKTCEI